MLSAYRPEFEAALRLLARISEAMHRRGLQRPVLEEEMVHAGFVRPSGSGQMLKGWVHLDLKLGFEVVAEVPMDGNVDAAHIRLVEPIGETARIRVISVEDLIADRMGQYASGTAPDRRDQARLLLSLHPDADMDYLDRRIREESMGDYGVQDITG